MYPQNVPQEEAFLPGCDLKIATGSRYIGGFLGTEADRAWWLEETPTLLSHGMLMTLGRAELLQASVNI